ncbi:LamG-like jellyroll fold domain-containing protein [Pseudoxanthomonas sp.]|uniref:LamG-like jellyroll fold domain-containing protein n=1 Tax=Pseudoxanthomonas sp. TaxID=1871049 RepID=UPI00260FBF4C|nr:LamG-like jellyroll fold domain-containing protein [Pseudoxanthomonas sp.]WDS38154.1 MAG: LamG domain-containing protein [Pseudoxanthomonas sp.]
MGLLGLCSGSAWAAQPPQLLFRVSADHGFDADVAGGQAVPNFRDKVKLVDNGKSGKAIEWADDGVLSWNAPGNLYTQRGTLSFFWRSREPVGQAPFVIFRVGYADHTSWDMAWLRIDWNGHGFDAFVTDANLARVRVSFDLPAAPAASDWTHIAFAWDETLGVRLYVDGKEAARRDTTIDLDAGLDQFGLAGRVMSPHQVQSRYNFLRGSDFDEIRIYDRMLDGAGMAALAALRDPASVQSAGDVQQAWLHRYGWDRHAPPVLDASVTAIRKVEFADARDLKAWMFKGTDGIAETTWPGVYNRSRLAGRTDYFELPDWNVYVEGGKALDLALPDEPFNRIEIRGAAYGRAAWSAQALASDASAQMLFERPQGVVRSVDQFAPLRGGHLRFTNVEQETPIQEIWAYNVAAGQVPRGAATLDYTVQANALPDYDNLAELRAFIDGRYPVAERSTVVALPNRAPARVRKPMAAVQDARPIVHILVPSTLGDPPPDQPLMRSWAYGWTNMHDGLDGIAIDLPALDLPAVRDGLIPLNLQVKDPIWPARDMIDVSVSVRPGQARTVWLDLRDRILPDQALYLSIASAAPGFNAAALEGAGIHLVFKPRAQAVVEHVADRFNQARDNWGFLVEEHTTSRRQLLYRRLERDMHDLLRVDPEHTLGRVLWNDISYGNQDALPVEQPVAPKDVPAWAFWQLEDLKLSRAFVNWWIDQRQVDYGDFGGGISDDTDLTQQWPGLALMGVDPDKFNASMLALSEANYRNGMFTNGLSTIETDELHSYEEGINLNSELLYLNWGDPRTVERIMQTTHALTDIITVNPHGDMLFSSNWFGGRKVYREPNWQWQKPYSFPIVHPLMQLGAYNADPTARGLITGLADGYLAHAYTNAKGQWALPNEIHWATGATRGGELFDGSGGSELMHTFWAAWRFSGDDKYLRPLDYRVDRAGPGGLSLLGENFLDALGKRDSWGQRIAADADKDDASPFARFTAWEDSGDTAQLATLFRTEAREKQQNFYLNTDGQWWSDRVESPTESLQRARLGGVALKRNQTWQGNTVSWRFDDPDGAVQVGLLLPRPTPISFTVIGYNLSSKAQAATMTGWNISAGRWRMTSGVDRDGDGRIDGKAETREFDWQKSGTVAVRFPPRQQWVMTLELVTPAATPVEQRADVGIGIGDVQRADGAVIVTVHSLGHIDAPAGLVLLEDAQGRRVAQATFPALDAPRDLQPRTAQVRLELPAGFKAEGARLRLVTNGEVPEVTLRNNTLALPAR